MTVNNINFTDILINSFIHFNTIIDYKIMLFGSMCVVHEKWNNVYP